MKLLTEAELLEAEKWTHLSPTVANRMIADHRRLKQRYAMDAGPITEFTQGDAFVRCISCGHKGWSSQDDLYHAPDCLWMECQP